jgi:hypothetical protein
VNNVGQADGSVSSGESGDNEETAVTVEPVRRSTRVTKGRHSNPNRLPHTAVQHDAVVVARAVRPSFSDFSRVVLGLQQQTLNSQQQAMNSQQQTLMNMQQQTFSEAVQVLKGYCGDGN